MFEPATPKSIEIWLPLVLLAFRQLQIQSRTEQPFIRGLIRSGTHEDITKNCCAMQTFLCRFIGDPH